MLKFIVPSSFMYLTVLSNFKTSYVEVYPFWVALIPAILLYFKTSYVEVYQVAAAVIGFVLANFKTSYVEVYQEILLNFGCQ